MDTASHPTNDSGVICNIDGYESDATVAFSYFFIRVSDGQGVKTVIIIYGGKQPSLKTGVSFFRDGRRHSQMLSLANGGTQFSHYIHPFRPHVSLGRS